MAGLSAAGVVAAVVVGLFGGAPPRHAPRAVTTRAVSGASAFVSVSGSDAGSCSAAAPCATLARAYQVVSPGATVEVGAGSYPAQLIPYNLAKPAGAHCDAESGDLSGCITFEPAAGAAVTLASFHSEAPYVQLQDMALPGGLTIGGGPRTRSYTCTDIQAHDDIVRRITSNDAFVFEGASHSALLDSSFSLGDGYRPNNGTSQFSPCSDTVTTTINDHLLIDGITMRDLLQTQTQNAAGCTSWQCMHLECIHLNQANNTTIRDSQFLNCAGHDVEVESVSTGGGMSGLLFENNIFDKPCSHQGAPCADQGGGLIIDCHVADGPIRDVTVRFNTFNGFAPSWASENGCQLGGTQLALGNVGSLTTYACSVYQSLGTTYAYNVWDGTTCSPTDKNAPNSYTDPTTYDFHLLPNAAAIDRVPAAAHVLRADLEGTQRPVRWPSDSGALQREPATIVPGRSIGEARIGAPDEAVFSFYGQPHHLTIRRWNAKENLPTAVYHVHGGVLRVGFANGRVAAVATTSSYYATLGGLSASAPVSASRQQVVRHCESLYQLPSAPLSTFARTSGARQRVIEISITRLDDTVAQCTRR